MTIIVSGFGNTGKKFIECIKSENNFNIHDLVTSYIPNNENYNI